MATPYSTIYNNFLGRITDYSLLSFIDSDKENILHGYMINTCAKFNRICLVDLNNRDEVTSQFNETLTDEIIDIITTGMIVEWLKPKYYLDEHMKNVLNTNDYKLASSPANMLSAIREIYQNTLKEFKSMIKEYSYINGSINNL